MCVTGLSIHITHSLTLDGDSGVLGVAWTRDDAGTGLEGALSGILGDTVRIGVKAGCGADGRASTREEGLIICSGRGGSLRL
jgi:hypothetical protein